MKVAAAVAEILKREGVEFLIGYPVNPIIEAAAEADIRTIIVRQERTGLHMADAVSRVTSGERDRRLQHAARPGHRERLRRRRPGLRRLRADRRPPDGLPAPHRQRPAQLLDACSTSARHQVDRAGQRGRRRPRRDAPRLHPGRATAARARPWSRSRPTSCRGGPGELDYTPAPRIRSGPDPRDVERVARGAGRGRAAGDLRRPGRPLRQGLGRAYASWPSCSKRRSRPASQGKSAFPENHPLSLGSGGRSMPRAGPPLPRRTPT